LAKRGCMEGKDHYHLLWGGGEGQEGEVGEKNEGTKTLVGGGTLYQPKPGEKKSLDLQQNKRCEKKI